MRPASKAGGLSEVELDIISAAARFPHFIPLTLASIPECRIVLEPPPTDHQSIESSCSLTTPSQNSPTAWPAGRSVDLRFQAMSPSGPAIIKPGM